MGWKRPSRVIVASQRNTRAGQRQSQLERVVGLAPRLAADAGRSCVGEKGRFASWGVRTDKDAAVFFGLDRTGDDLGIFRVCFRAFDLRGNELRGGDPDPFGGFDSGEH